MWAWISIGAAGVIAYFVYTKISGSSTASQTAATTSTSGAGTASTSSSPGGFGFGGLGGSNPGSGTSNTATPTTSGLPFQVQAGSGWGPPNWAHTDQAGMQVTDASGTVYELTDWTEDTSLLQSGTQLYYQVLPGVFVAAPTTEAELVSELGGGIGGFGTPLYIQVPSGTGSNPAAPVATTAATAAPAPAATTQTTPPATVTPTATATGSPAGEA